MEHGDWGLGPIPIPKSPIPNPQSPIKDIISRNLLKIKLLNLKIIKIIIIIIHFKRSIQSNKSFIYHI